MRLRRFANAGLLCCTFVSVIAVADTLEGEATPQAETVTLQFQDIEVRRALHLIGELANQDIVVSDAVSGNLSLYLTAVTWREALDLILHTQQLAQQRIGDVLTIAPVAAVAASQKSTLQRHLDLEQMQPLNTQLLQIRYGRAKTFAALFGQKGNRLLSKRGAVAVDYRTNTLVVTDTVERLAWVQRTVKALDQPLRQVQIEARIAIVSSNSSQQLGVRWQLGATRGSADTTLTEADLETGRPASGLGVTLLHVHRANPTSWLDSQLSALAAKGQAKVLAKPAIMTIDNASALIESGVEIPYQEVSTSGATSTSFKEASLSLEVAPQITPDNQVVMHLRVKQDTVGQVFNGVPSINTNRMETHVTVADGQTLVLGGIFQTDRNRSSSRTPVLGAVPIIGGLFRHKSVRDDQQELLLFVTPTIMVEEKAQR